MPEPSGAGTNTDEQPPSTATGSEGSGGAAAGTPTDDAKAKQDAKLSAEAAKWRTQYREAQKQADALKSEIEELKSSIQTGSPAAKDDASELATVKRQLGDLQKSLKEQQDRAAHAEKTSKEEKLNNAILKAIGDAKLIDPEDAAILLKQKGRARIADDGKPVFVISEDGEEREEVISADSIRKHKLVSEKFFPAEGASGSGSRGGSRAAAPGLDWSRINDLTYFEKHKDEFLAAAKAR